MKIKSKGGIVCLLVAGGGLVVTMILTAKKAPEALKLKEEALKEKRERLGDEHAQLTWFESMKAQAGCYAPVAASALLTVGGIVGSYVLPESALQDLHKVHNAYKDVVKKVDGVKAEEKIAEMTEFQLQSDKTENKKITEKKEDKEKEPESDPNKAQRFAFFIGDHLIEFTSTMMKVLEGEYNANRYFKVNGELTLNKFFEFFECDPIDGGDDVGWQEYLGEIYHKDAWIDFIHKPVDDDGKKYILIDVPFEPRALEEEYINEDISKRIGFCKHVEFVDEGC